MSQFLVCKLHVTEITFLDLDLGTCLLDFAVTFDDDDNDIVKVSSH